MPKIAILTNARAPGQRSMIDYGEALLEAANQSGGSIVEWRAVSFFGRLPLKGALRKLALNLDRFVVTPLSLLGKQADLVHVVDPGNCVYLPLTRHVRSIITVHDMIPYLARDGKLSGWEPTRSGRWLMDRIIAQLAKADRVICVSYATKQDVLSYVMLPEERVTVIRNAVFQPMTPASPEQCAEVRKKYGLPPKAPLILHVGSNWYKNREKVLDVAAEVFKKRSDVHLVLVGSLNHALEKQADRLNLSERLSVLDYVASEDMSVLYTTAAVLLFPSHYEGFGLPVLEAQMCRTAVVCSNEGALPEVAEAASCVKLGSSFLTEAVNAVISAIDSPPQGRQAIQVGQQLPSPELWRLAHVVEYQRFEL